MKKIYLTATLTEYHRDINLDDIFIKYFAPKKVGKLYLFEGKLQKLKDILSKKIKLPSNKIVNLLNINGEGLEQAPIDIILQRNGKLFVLNKNYESKENINLSLVGGIDKTGKISNGHLNDKWLIFDDLYTEKQKFVLKQFSYNYEIIGFNQLEDKNTTLPNFWVPSFIKTL